MSASSIGDWTRRRRKELWLTQKKLARLVGCAPVTIQKIEEGQRRPSPAVAEALARHLEIETGDLERFLRLAKISPMPPRASGMTKSVSGQVPVPLTALIGREAERSSLKEMLLGALTRLLTLTGPPGVGKTRLALQLAQDLQPSFADGIYFVPLATLDNPEQVLPSIIRCLGLVDGGLQARGSRLQTFLRDKHLLLILDNFEHLLTAAPALSGLLEQCSGLRVLTTSRTALGLYGEQEWSLEPLPLPELADVADNPAVRLFTQRVQAFDPTFSLARHRSAVIEIVTRLQGLPLALELAAVRLRYASPEELAAQLQRQVLDALGTGPSDWSERQRTLQGAIAWSYERLEEHLKRIFRHLGLFIGGFDAASAAGVCAAKVEDLHVLLDGHLIQRCGERFTQLETLRAYAFDQLTTHKELDVARDTHLEYYLSALQTHAHTNLDWFEAEVGNFRVALRWALDQAKTEPALRLALGTWWFWLTRGYQREGFGWFKAALALPEGTDLVLRLSALNWGSTMAWQSGVFEPCHAWLLEALTLSRDVKSTEWEASLLMHQGKVALEQGHHQEALQALNPALILSRSLSDSPQVLISVLFQLADTALAMGDQQQTQRYVEEGLALCRPDGSFWEPNLLRVLGELALERQDFLTAHQILGEALGLVSKTEHKLMFCEVLGSFAAALTAPKAESPDLLRAARLWGAVEAVREANGYRWSLADAERIERWTEQARKRVPDLEWNLAWISGRAMTLPEALEYVLASKKVRVSRS